MLLSGKVAVVYGAGGAIGGAVARAFAREGARVFLAGRTQSTLDPIAAAIRSTGGVTDVDAINVLDEREADAYVDTVVARAGSIDISFNVISYGDVQKPLQELSVEDFLQPITTAMRGQFLTTRAAARHMTRRGSGVILHFGGSGPQTLPGLGGFKVALDALEGLRRQWAVELEPHGIRVVTLKTGGVPESVPAVTRAAVLDTLPPAPLNRFATLADVGNVAAFLASDHARTITDTEINISCGAIVD